MAEFNLPPIPEGETWTQDQWKAIHVMNKDILVAAAAGSGKTAVLVNRIIRKIISTENPINVDQLLVVTFTNASAAEMKHRIGEALEKEIDHNPTSRHLRKQLSLLNKASISTLHSFCLEVIRKYYYLIDVDPGFRIADETEAQLIRDEVMDELFEDEYGKDSNESFLRLVDSMTNDRSDDAIGDIIRSIYDFARANPAPEQYLQTIESMYDVDVAGKLEDLPFLSSLKFDIELQLEGAKELINKGLEMTRLPEGPAPKEEALQCDLQLINTLMKANHDSWENLYEAFKTIAFAKAKQVRGEQYSDELKDKCDQYRKKAKDKINKLKDELFSRRPESFLRDMAAMSPIIKALVSLVRSFSERFGAAKREKGLVDYADLEHYCLQILTADQTSRGEFFPSQAALDYRYQFKEVYCDEYQDVNMVQETILKLVANPNEANGNLFMVGDVKQSIYRFRLAEPNLFLGKYNHFRGDGEGTGLRIDLAQNFRSRMEILQGTNYLFKQIMGVRVGEIDYNDAAELREGAPYPKTEVYPIELLLINQTGTIEESTETDGLLDGEMADDGFNQVELEKSQLEARVMAGKIKELIAGGAQVFNAKTQKYQPLTYRDVVILLRSMTWAPQIIEEFKLQGIPIYANLSTGYFEATEVSIMMSLLHCIDNPYQDIPLAAVLRSPIVGLNEEELARIRIYKKRGSFWESVAAFCKSPEAMKEAALYDKVRYFYDSLAMWRDESRQGSLAELIWQLYRETRFYDFVGGLPGGKQRQANLRALYDRARQYEKTSFRGLFRFLRFIERMIERGDDLGAARALGEQEDVVRIMTIHSSKGLEFPIVFIAGLSKNFNMQDIRAPYMLDKEYGFAAKYVDLNKRIITPSLPLLAFARKKKMEMLAEEMRVLYVALTRAKEKLYLLASLKDVQKQIERWNDAAQTSKWLLKDDQRASAGSYIDWIGPALVRHKDAHELRRGDISIREQANDIITHPSVWKISILGSEEIKNQASTFDQSHDSFLTKIEKAEPIPVHSLYTDEVINRLSWEYGHANAVLNRSKQTVSELKRQQEMSDEYSGTELIKPRFQKAILNRPKFMQEKTLTPAERGTTMHLVMQHVDLTKKVTVDSILNQVEQMVISELLTAQQAEVVDAHLIAEFFASDLGKRYFTAQNLKREVPFTRSLPAKNVYSSWDEEQESILVQGVIDCIFEDESGLVLIDYKTDRITDRFKGGFEQAKPVLLERYRVQIEIYAEAIESIWKRKVNEKYLFFFDGAHLVKV